MAELSPPRLTFEDPAAWAAATLRERLPRIVEGVARQAWLSDAARIKLAELRQSLPAGRVLDSVGPAAPDRVFWTEYLRDVRGATWAELTYLEAEFIFYEAILDALDYAATRRDPFAPTKGPALEQASRSFARAASEAAALGVWSYEATRAALRAALTGNTADLSQLASTRSRASREPLVDDGPAFFADFAPESSGTIDLLLDNAGEELLGDLVLIDHLLRALPGVNVRVHVKRHPIFVSDATREDWGHTVERLRNDATPEVAAWGGAFIERERAGRLVVCDDAFWCRPLFFSEMGAQLRSKLAGSLALILKGDLNYRRYVEDRAWPFDHPTSQHRIRELPPTLTLRVLKSELAVGLPAAAVAELQASEPDWLYNGQNSVIQYFR